VAGAAHQRWANNAEAVPQGGYFGAIQWAAEVAARFRVPEGGGRPTDPSWIEKRLFL
jgi:hypothetical protein